MRHQAEPGRAGHDGLAVLERGVVEGGRPAQRGQRARHRQREQPALALGGPQQLERRVQVAAERVETQQVVGIDDMVGDVGSDDRPFRLLDRCWR